VATQGLSAIEGALTRGRGPTTIKIGSNRNIAREKQQVIGAL
jgi:hypothetical protein